MIRIIMGGTTGRVESVCTLELAWEDHRDFALKTIDRVSIIIRTIAWQRLSPTLLWLLQRQKWIIVGLIKTKAVFSSSQEFKTPSLMSKNHTIFVSDG